MQVVPSPVRTHLIRSKWQTIVRGGSTTRSGAGGRGFTPPGSAYALRPRRPPRRGRDDSVPAVGAATLIATRHEADGAGGCTIGVRPRTLLVHHERNSQLRNVSGALVFPPGNGSASSLIRLAARGHSKYPPRLYRQKALCCPLLSRNSRISGDYRARNRSGAREAARFQGCRLSATKQSFLALAGC